MNFARNVCPSSCRERPEIARGEAERNPWKIVDRFASSAGASLEMPENPPPARFKSAGQPKASAACNAPHERAIIFDPNLAVECHF